MKKMMIATLACVFYMNCSWRPGVSAVNCCAKNCQPGREVPMAFPIGYSTQEKNASYCSNYVSGYCGGIGYLCTAQEAASQNHMPL